MIKFQLSKRCLFDHWICFPPATSPACPASPQLRGGGDGRAGLEKGLGSRRVPWDAPGHEAETRPPRDAPCFCWFSTGKTLSEEVQHGFLVDIAIVEIEMLSGFRMFHFSVASGI